MQTESDLEQPMKLVAPNGLDISRTVEIIESSHGIINEGVTRNPDGSFAFEYDAQGTQIDWDATETNTEQVETPDGKRTVRVFLDVSGNTWREHELSLTPIR